MFYFELFNAFYQEKVQYLVVGGLAVIYMVMLKEAHKIMEQC
ncbi:MAG: hypothetical protein HW390_2759 [Candidatus Brocadiaceae bacterium]|nr:hypothetical protein [Candidatus Brocadiaceae bacterium]